MRSLVTWCLNRRSVVLLALFIMLGAGIFGYTQLRQQLFPNIEFPFLIATVDTPGLSAETADQTVAQKLSSAATQIEEVRNVTTVAQGGAVRIYAQLEYGTNMDDVRGELLDNLEAVELPQGTGDVEIQSGFTDQAVVTASLNQRAGQNAAELRIEAEKLQDAVEKIEGVGSVDLAGMAVPTYSVTVKPSALNQGWTPVDVAAAIKSTQLVQPAGAVLENGSATPLVVTGTGIKSREALEAMTIGNVRLGTIATVTEQNDSGTNLSRTNGKPSVTLLVYRTQDANEVEVVEETLAAFKKAEKNSGKGSITTIFESASEVKKSLRGLIIEAGLGALFAVFSIFLFLRSARPTFVAAVSIPSSLVFGLLVAWMLGLTLDIITLAGLTIAIGRVIDDAIVVLENIFRHAERGDSTRDAVINGTSEVAVAITSSTLATVAVFLPIGLVGGFISEIFYSFSIIVSVALLASLVIAVTVIPVIASMLIRHRGVVAPAAGAGGAGEHDVPSGSLARKVTPATRFGIRYPWIVIPAAFLCLFAAIMIVASGAIKVQFLPDSATQQIYGTVDLPPGTAAGKASKVLQPIESWLADTTGVRDYQIAYGDAAIPDPSQSPSTASFYVSLADSADAERIVKDLRAKGSKQYGGVFTVQRLENGPPTGTFQVSVEGPNQAAIKSAADTIVKLLNKTDNVVEIQSKAATSQPQIAVEMNPGAPVSATDVAATIAALSTIVPAGTSVDGRDIAVGAPAHLLSDTASLQKLPVYPGAGSELMSGGTGSSYAVRRGFDPLVGLTIGSVSSLKRVDRPAFITRTDTELSSLVSARILGDNSGSIIRELQADIKKLDLGKAKTSYEQGDAEFLRQMFTDLVLAIIVAVILVYILLVLFFGSLIQPITILTPVMFSFIGCLLALAITDNSLGLPAMIGMLLLIGIVVSNSILLVDTTERMRRSGMNRTESLVRAAQLRVRPVLMTAVATIAALLPLALGISGEGGIISKSLGVTVIGGLAVATLLTLVVVPATYTFFDWLSHVPARIWRRIRQQKADSSVD